jgi:hypothetical protein
MFIGGDGENNPDGHQVTFVHYVPNLTGAAGHVSLVFFDRKKVEQNIVPTI